MLQWEKKAWNLLLKNIWAVALVLGTALSVWVRFLFRDMITYDMQAYWYPWFVSLKEAGGLAGLKEKTGDYGLPFQAIIALLSYLNGDPLYLFKILFTFFDYLLGGAIGYLVYLLTEKNQTKGFFAYLIVLFLPVTFINSAAWGQCDAFFSFFCILALIFLFQDRFLYSFIAYGAAFALKLQAVLILPFFLFYYVEKKKYSILHFLIIPCVMTVMSLPSLIHGRPFSEVFSIYFEQLSLYPKISYNYASFWNILLNVGEENWFDSFRGAAIMVTFVILLLMMAYLLSAKETRNRGNGFSLRLCHLFAYTCVFFLPSMHERYDYLPIMLGVALLFVDVRTIPFFVLQCYVHLSAAGKYCFGISVDWKVLVFLNLISYIGYCALTFVPKKKGVAVDNGQQILPVSSETGNVDRRKAK